MQKITKKKLDFFKSLGIIKSTVGCHITPRMYHEVHGREYGEPDFYQRVNKCILYEYYYTK